MYMGCMFVDCVDRPGDQLKGEEMSSSVRFQQAVVVTMAR